MKDYPDRMSPEQARRFGEDVLNIVSQIPRGKVTTYGDISSKPMDMWIWSGIFGSQKWYFENNHNVLLVKKLYIRSVILK